MTRLTKTSLLLAIAFAIDKALAILRQIVIARQFGLSPELDAFNVANNIPDLLFALISGGALAIAFIPVLSEVLMSSGRQSAWDLFARVANLAFIVTGFLALIVAILAGPMVRAQFGIAPGFGSQQQALVITLMRLNLVATLIFSISGLVMAGLQANQHFLLPALAPLLYNTGQIFGAVILAPAKGYTIAHFTLPAFGLGVHGLVYGVILGAALHLGVQVPGLIKYQFHWIPKIGLNNPAVIKVLRMMGPRLITMLLIQLVFIIRDNLASRLAPGSVSALTYGWMIQQVPETLIGTAIGTALLPTLAEQVSKKDREAFQRTVQKAIQVLLALTLPTAVILAVGLRPFLSLAFGFGAPGTDLLLWTTRGFLIGLIGHSLLEVASRSFYAQQDALTPMVAAMINVILYIGIGSQLYRPLGPVGISLTDSIVFTTQAVLMLFLLTRPTFLPVRWIKTLWSALTGRSHQILPAEVKAVDELRQMISLPTDLTPWRALLAAAAGGAAAIVVQFGLGSISPLISATAAMMVGVVAATPFVWPEVKKLFHL